MLAGALALASAAPASAQLATSCGSYSVNPNPLATNTSPEGHFKLYVDALASVPSGYGEALDHAYDVQKADGWYMPPGRPYTVVISGTGKKADAAATGTPGDNPNTPWTETDATSACMGMTNDLTGTDLTGSVDREFNRMVLFGYGALTPAVEPIFAQGGPILAEEETDNVNIDEATLWPDFTKSLLDYGTGGWIALEGLAAQHGGFHVMQKFWEHISKGDQPGSLAALDAALADTGSTTLTQAFHEAAIAMIVMKKCPLAAPFCFAKADEYLAAKPAGAPAVQASIQHVGDQPLTDAVPDGYGLRWIGLPTGRQDLTIANTASKGTLQASAICTSADGSLLRTPFPAPIAAGGSGVIHAFPSADCTGPLLVVSSSANEDAQAAQRSFAVASTAPTATLSLSIAGDGAGKVTSTPTGIDCPTDCTETLPADTSIDLTAAPANGSTFTGWGGACASAAKQATCTLKLSDAATAVATFAKVVVTPTPTATATPVVTPPSKPVGPTLPPTVTGDHTAPKVRVSRARFSKKALKITVVCPADEANRCSGFVSVAAKVKGKKLKFADQAFIRLKAGASATLNYRLTSRSRRLLGHTHKVRVKVTVRARDDAFNYATTTRTLTVKR